MSKHGSNAGKPSKGERASPSDPAYHGPGMQSIKSIDPTPSYEEEQFLPEGFNEQGEHLHYDLDIATGKRTVRGKNSSEAKRQKKQ